MGQRPLSVLTDKEFFQGDLRYLAEIKRALPIPALNKEFMVGDVQFYEARAHGADAVLLIVAALERRQLMDFHALATELGMDSLFETHHERELDTVLEWIPTARMIGINNRDLQNVHDRSQCDVSAGETNSARQADHQRERNS